MASEAKRRANIAYNKRQDNIMIRPSKERGAEIRAAAAQEGQSVQAFILRVLEEYINEHDLQQGDGDDGGR